MLYNLTNPSPSEIFARISWAGLRDSYLLSVIWWISYLWYSINWFVVTLSIVIGVNLWFAPQISEHCPYRLAGRLTENLISLVVLVLRLFLPLVLVLFMSVIRLLLLRLFGLHAMKAYGRVVVQIQSLLISVRDRMSGRPHATASLSSGERASCTRLAGGWVGAQIRSCSCRESNHNSSDGRPVV